MQASNVVELQQKAVLHINHVLAVKADDSKRVRAYQHGWNDKMMAPTKSIICPYEFGTACALDWIRGYTDARICRIEV